MSRPSGRKNEDHEQTRHHLVQRAAVHLTSLGGADASFRELADRCGVSSSTLRHYFSTREQLVEEVFALLGRQGDPYHLEIATRVPRDVETSLRAFLAMLLEGWSAGVGAIHAFGLRAGTGDARVGPLYVERILEPTLQSFEARLARHVADGTFPRCDLRAAGLSFLSPVLLALLHQDSLSGRTCRPLDLEDFVDQHVKRWLRGWGHA